jgi:hypothetical protein
MKAEFYSQDTLFIDNISENADLFEVDFNGDEYTVYIEPKNANDLKEICDILCKYSKDYDDLGKLTSYRLTDGYLHDYFIELSGDIEGNKIVDDAIAYMKSYFEKEN